MDAHIWCDGIEPLACTTWDDITVIHVFSAVYVNM